MRHIYDSAILQVNMRIQACGKAIAKASDQYTLTYWHMELAKANYKRSKIQKRNVNWYITT